MCFLDESGKDEVGCNRKVESGRRIAGAIRSLVNARSLQLERDRGLHESFLVPVLSYSIETMIGRDKERSIIRVVQMDTLGMKRMDKVPNARIMQLCGVTKSGDKKIDEGVLRWFGHV